VTFVSEIESFVNMENLVFEEKWLPTATVAIMRLLKEWVLEMTGW
jgi:hypothetical protein